jgi:GAF domain-containing protein
MEPRQTAVAGPRTTSPLVAKVATAIVAHFLDAIGADAGFVATIAADRESLAVTRVTPFSQEPTHLSFPREAPYPIAHTMRTGNRLVIASNAELCEHPGLVRVKSEDHACATMPLFDEEGELLGAINLGYDEPHAFSQNELEAIEALARHCAEAMIVAQTVEDDVTRRVDATSPTP